MRPSASERFFRRLRPDQVGWLGPHLNASLVSIEEVSERHGARVVLRRVAAQVVFVRADARAARGAAGATVELALDADAIGVDPDTTRVANCHCLNCRGTAIMQRRDCEKGMVKKR